MGMVISFGYQNHGNVTIIEKITFIIFLKYL